MALVSDHTPKRHSTSLKASCPPSKRTCTSPRSATANSTTFLTTSRPLPPIETIIHLPRDSLHNLRKQDLRNYFVTLQQYARSPYPLTYAPSATLTTSSPKLSSDNLPSFLRLPLEIRELIYTYTLPPPISPPIRGPHPRQLQGNIHLTQPIVPSLLLLNHQIRHEALPIFYGGPTQIVHLTIDFNVWAHKTRRSDLIISPALTSAIKHLHISIHLGSEKRATKPGEIEADARIAEVKKGIKKLGKWLGAADIQTLKIDWREPPQTYTWVQKRDILDGMRGWRAAKVDAGEINWGLDWNKGRRFRFEVEYLKMLERGRQISAGSGSKLS